MGLINERVYFISAIISMHNCIGLIHALMGPAPILYVVNLDVATFRNDLLKM